MGATFVEKKEIDKDTKDILSTVSAFNGARFG